MRLKIKTKQELRRFAMILLTAMLPVQMFLGYVVMAQPVQAQLNTNTTSAPVAPTYQGVDTSIDQYLCTPNDSDLGGALFTCIKRIYRFGVAFGAIAVVFFIVFAGYMYISGGESAKTKAKEMIQNSIIGIALMLGSYILLGFINPDLVRIKPIQTPIFSASDLPKCADVGFGVNCVLPDGQVSNPGGGSGTAGSASEAKYKDLISKYAQANGLEYCAFSALIEQESHFTYNMYSSPDYVIRFVDVSKGPPSYGISYPTYHAIGLTQITIYTKDKGGWVGDTPARSDPGSFGKSPLTMQMLLDPDTNLSAGAFFFGKLYKKYGDVNKAYGHYFGSGDTPPVDLSKKYNACKLRG